MPLFEDPRRETTVVVTLYETLADVMARLRTHANGVVLLEIPDGSPLFLTSSEMRALREVAQQRRISLTILSDDALRAQLAGLFSLPIIGSAEDLPEATTPPSRPTGPRDPRPVPSWDREGLPPLPGEQRQAARSDPTPTPPGSGRELSPRERSVWPRGRPLNAPGPVPNRALPRDDDRRPDTPFDHGAQTRRPASPAPKGRDGQALRWPEAAGSPDGRRSTGRVPVVPPDAGRDGRDDSGRGGRGSPIPTMGGRGMSGRGMLALLGGGIAAILVITLLLGIFVLSSAQVTIALAAERVTGTVDCQIVAPGESGSATVVIEGEQREVQLSWTGSVPTTGTRPEADAVASGRVRLSNPTDDDVTVTAGTEMSSRSGLTFTVTEDVTVAAGNPALGQYGSGEALVQAVDGGTVGNLAVGELSGVLESGVYYSNRDAALAGGTDRDIATVQPADVQALHDQATEALRQQAANGEIPGLDRDIQVVPATVELDTPDFEDDLQSGDDGESVSTTATAQATVLTYDNADLRLRATGALIPILEAQLGPGLTLSESTVALTAQGTPGEQSAAGATFDISGIANTSASLSDADADALAEQLAGQSPSDVNSILTANERIASFDVDYSPGWLPDRMPNSADRITVTVRQ